MSKKFTKSLILSMLLLCSASVWAQRTVTGIVTGISDKKPLPEAIVLLKGSNIGTVADDNGNYSISLPENSGTLIFTYIGYQSKEVVLGADLTVDVALEEGVELNNVTVVGTRNASRTRLESPVPVDIIPVRAVVNEVGQVDINQLLHYAAPSFNSNRLNTWDGGDHIDPASLRGLGTDQVLVLVNGKRRHTTAFINVIGTPSRGQAATDMSSIPAYAIERIEILRDGASAQYGSDAIAGVINIVLRKDVNRFTAAVTSGINLVGDGLTSAGNANYGFKIGKKGYLSLSGEYRNRQASNRTNEWSGPIYNNAEMTDTTRDEEWNYNNSIVPNTGKTAKQLDDAELIKRGTTRRTFAMRMGQSSQTSYGGMFNFSLPINDKVEVYAFGGANQKGGISAGFYRFPGSDGNVAAMYPEGFLPQIKSTIQDLSGALGVRGTINKWAYDMSSVYGTNSFQYSVINSANVSREAYIAAVPNSGLSPQKREFDCGTVGFQQSTTNLDISRRFDNLFNGTNFAFGGEYRTERYTQKVGELDSYKQYKSLDAQGNDTLNASGGAQVFPGFENVVDGSRNSVAVYGDMEADFTDKLMMGVALRYEEYSDFGLTQNYKLVAKYKVVKQFMLRGSASTGFRAPSVHQMFYTTKATSFTAQGEKYELGLFTNDSPAATVLGIPKLKQETSLNYSAGFALKPTEDFEMTLDGYYMDITNRIVLTGEFNSNENPTTQQDITIANLLASKQIGRAAFFTNAVDTRTRGLDLVTSYHHKFGTHDFRFVLAANFNRNEVVGDIKTSDLLKGKESTYFSRENVSHIEQGAPQTKVTFSINWKYNKMWAMLRNVYFGQVAYISPESDPTLYDYNTDKIQSLDQVFTPKVVTDLTLGYKIAKNVNFSIGASNLLNVYPDKHTHAANNFYGQFPYSIYVQQFGIGGAYYFARLSYDLRTNTK